jgi:hypothetical protein
MAVAARKKVRAGIIRGYFLRFRMIHRILLILSVEFSI